MQKLRINELDQLHGLKITPDLVRRGRQLNRAQTIGYWRTMFHEMAHGVAGMACPGSHLRCIEIYPPSKRSQQFRGALGRMHGVEIYEDETRFVTLAGYAAEYLLDRYTAVCPNGPLLHLAGNDFKEAYHPEFAWVLDEALKFVVANQRLIQKCVVGYVLLARKDGVLEGKRLDGLVGWTRKQLTPFISRDRHTPFKFAGRLCYPPCRSNDTPLIDCRSNREAKNSC